MRASIAVMVGWQGAQIGDVDLCAAVGRLKAVPPEGNLLRTARALGLCLGD